MQLGSLPEWLSAVGGFLAVAAAIVAWRVSARLLKVEQSRDAVARDAKYRSQAELVFALGAKLPKRDQSETWAIFLVNASSKPIYDVRVKSRRIDSGEDNPELTLGAVLPGRYVIARHPKFKWGILQDYDRLEEPVELLVKGKGYEMIKTLSFADAKRVNWFLENGVDVPVSPSH